MPCRYCDSATNKQVKSHVIPEGFFRRTDDGSGPLRFLSQNSNQYPKRARIGVYDQSILCEVCEPLFGDWDAYAQALLAEQPKDAKRIVMPSGQVVGHEIEQYDYTKLKLFFISLLWRASVSTQQFYEGISLGKYENKARNLLRTNNPGDVETFAVTLAMFDDHPLKKAMLNPAVLKLEGVNYCQFEVLPILRTENRRS